MKCVVPKKIHTHPKEGHWKFPGGGGHSTEINWNFLEGGEGGCKTKTFHGGSMDISWNCTIQGTVKWFTSYLFYIVSSLCTCFDKHHI